MRRAVITGIGVVSPLGCDLDLFWERIKAGESGVGLIDKFDVSEYDVRIGAQVADFDMDGYIDRKERRRMDAFTQYAMVASKKAVENSGLNFENETPERVGVVIGSGVGGLSTLEKQYDVLTKKGPRRVSPFTIPMMISNMASGMVAIAFGARGPNYTVVSACASAAHSLADVLRIIQRDEADVMISGGTEAPICTLGLSGFAAMKALSTRNDDPTAASRPFDRERDGFVMGEGAGVLVVEELEHARARGADIYCEIAGAGLTCDAYHMTAPAETGEGATRAMKMAMQNGGVNPEDVDYINAHGTSTPLNDKIETRAIKSALGEEAARKVMISSSKSMTGHLLGAAAGVESAVCALAIRDGIVSPTINHQNPDPECDLDYVPNEAREKPVNITLNNSLGFGGHNACLAFRKV